MVESFTLMETHISHCEKYTCEFHQPLSSTYQDQYKDDKPPLASSEKTNFQYYWGKPRKPAVKTKPPALRPNNLQQTGAYPNGKSKLLFPFEQDTEIYGEAFLDAKPEIDNSRRVLVENHQRGKEETKSDCNHQQPPMRLPRQMWLEKVKYMQPYPNCDETKNYQRQSSKSPRQRGLEKQKEEAISDRYHQQPPTRIPRQMSLEKVKYMQPYPNCDETKSYQQQQSNRISCQRDILLSRQKARCTQLYSYPNEAKSYPMKRMLDYPETCVIDVIEERKNALRLFREQYKLIKKQGCEKPSVRIDLQAWKVVQESGLLLKEDKFVGPVPGVEIEDSFEFRIELVIMGIHSQILHGIDYKETAKGQVIATSIVATEGYDDIMVKPNELIYTGEGGNFEGISRKMGRDQVLKNGNLALKNSIIEKNYVRVVRGFKTRNKRTSFIYDGLYKVVSFDRDLRDNGTIQFKFKLERCIGQKTIAWAKYK